jgi:NitT/TauT family transport system substrate-binding protein
MNVTRGAAMARTFGMLAVAGSSLSAPAIAQVDTPVRITAFPNFVNLPIYLAMDKGYFAKEHLDVDVHKIQTSPSSMLPSIARGDVDISPLTISAGFFNQFAQGFDVKLVSSISGPKKGWNDSVYFVVRQDDWDAKPIRTLGDLAGKTVDVAGQSSTLEFIFRQALDFYHLKPSDFNITYRFRTPPDWFAAFQNKAVDAMPIVEPMATQMQLKGVGHKMFGLVDVAPWYQDTFLAVSPAFARDHPDAVVRFLRAFTKAQHEILKSGNKWTPEYVATVSKWTDIPPDVIQQLIGPAYPGDLGVINLESLNRQQNFYLESGIVPKAVPVASLVDTHPLEAAKATV